MTEQINARNLVFNYRTQVDLMNINNLSHFFQFDAICIFDDLYKFFQKQIYQRNLLNGLIKHWLLILNM